jgi:molybdopterin molybdotransferase
MPLSRLRLWKGKLTVGIELEQAAEIIRAQARAGSETESREVHRLYGRICAEDIRSAFDIPPFDRSPLDGYAFRARDSAGASKQSPAELAVTEEIAAGQWPQKSVTPGTAARLMTGAPIPEGADCVIRQEETDEGRQLVRVFKELAPLENICRQGEDIARGGVLVRAGERLNHVQAGLLAGAGISSIQVYQRPRVFLLVTGDELWLPAFGEPPPGKIYSSNHALLSARLRELGAETLLAEPCADDGCAIARRISDAAKAADLVITTGGVSVGDRDLVPEAMGNLGAKILFHGVNMKPGTPAMFSLYGQLPILSLSGNPFAALATMELLARPALAVLARNEALELHYENGILANGFPTPSPGRRFIRGTARRGVVRLADGPQASGVLGSMRGCNCLVDIPAGTGRLLAGDEVRLVRLD